MMKLLIPAFVLFGGLATTGAVFTLGGKAPVPATQPVAMTMACEKDCDDCTACCGEDCGDCCGASCGDCCNAGACEGDMAACCQGEACDDKAAACCETEKSSACCETEKAAACCNTAATCHGEAAAVATPVAAPAAKSGCCPSGN
jgi:hypothetical protein